jgi:hypothetical protein
MPRYLASLALTACVFVLSACCGGGPGACNGSSHLFYVPVPYVSHVP